ncbi:hypothetical protein ANN_02129 [Periplaneta americana]|uniref:Fidgetin-like protein 1 n=1 Tax=Periplaneta americana TaxID=6978 RepID=A0ABQ8TVE2_PERAM|nr:hypothetical protein ANN_02129 [Periplaneta americana]
MMKTLINRARRVAEPRHIQRELSHVSTALMANGYSRPEIKRAMRPRVRPSMRSQERATKKGTVFLPYLRNVTDRISRVLKRHEVETTFLPTKQIRNMLRSSKDKRDKLLSAGVYRIPCSCGKVYIEQIRSHYNKGRNPEREQRTKRRGPQRQQASAREPHYKYDRTTRHRISCLRYAEKSLATSDTTPLKMSAAVADETSGIKPTNRPRPLSPENESTFIKYVTELGNLTLLFKIILKVMSFGISIQNMKKWGSRGNNSTNCYSTESVSTYNYGGQKRSLGARRGVMNKFVPPVRSNNNDDFEGAFGGNQRQRKWDQNGGDEEEEMDERLKNIDPKMVALIKNEIMDNGTPVTWDDIAGLEFAKATIQWIGDGEKMVRALFAVARCHQPAVVFIDEIDSLLTQRSDTEHESSRRIKTEFLVQLDGAATGEEDRILVIGATNRPQELDEAARRRLVKKLYIPLPEFPARRQIVDRLMSDENHNLTEEDVHEIATLTDGYSGADMKNLCQEASLGPIRSLGFIEIQHISPDQVRPVTVSDFKSALNRVRASVSPGDLDSYVAWDKLYGSGM